MRYQKEEDTFSAACHTKNKYMCEHTGAREFFCFSLAVLQVFRLSYPGTNVVEEG